MQNKLYCVKSFLISVISEKMDSVLQQIMVFLRSPLGIVLIVIFIVIVIANRRRKQKVGERVKQVQENSSLMDMSYTAPGARKSNDDTGIYSPPPVNGTHAFSGTSNGIKWVANTVFLKEMDSDRQMSGNLRNIPKYIRWSSEQVRTTGSYYLMLMDMRDKEGKEAFSNKQINSGDGIMATIANKAATIALGFFIRAYFGKIQNQSTEIEPKHRISIESKNLSERFAIFTNNKELSLNILSQETEDWLLQETVYRPSYLINSTGIMAASPASMVSSSEVHEFAGYCSTVANLVAKHL